MAGGAQPKWEGKVRAKLIGSTPDQVWTLLEDFCSLNKYLTTIETCYRVEGEYGKPGLTRYCGSTVPLPSGDIIQWCHEKILVIDPIGWSMTYDVLDNNMGFKLYVSHIKVLPIDGGDRGRGCEMEWSFVADPVDGHTSDDLLSYIDTAVHTMAESIGKALQSTTV